MINNPGSRRRALIIGISDYDNDELEPLMFCKNDGREMVDVLNSLHYETRENNILLGKVRWETMRDAIYDFFSDENINPTDARLGHSTMEKVILRGEGKCILAASQAKGEAYVLEEHNHSVFTYYLLEALRGKVMEAIDNNGCLTVDSLSKYVYNALMSLPPSKRPKQKPVRKIEASGDIILAYYPKKVVASNEPVSGDDVKSMIDKCQHYFKKGDFEKVLDYLQGVINRYPNNSDFWNYRGNALAKLNRHDEAISCFDVAIMLNPKSANLLMNKGDSLSKKGRIEESIKSFDNAIKLDTNNSRALSLKARLLLNQGKYGDALECLYTATQKANEKVLWNDRGVALAGLGRHQEAIQSYENALKIDPNYDVTLNNKGLSLYNLGKYQEAVNCFDRILVLNPNVRNVLINKYRALNKLGKTAEADRCYERSQKIIVGYSNRELYDANGRLISQ